MQSTTREQLKIKKATENTAASNHKNFEKEKPNGIFVGPETKKKKKLNREKKENKLNWEATTTTKREN